MCKADAYKRLKTMENNFNCHPEKWLWLLTREGYLQEVETTGQNLTEHFGVLEL